MADLKEVKAPDVGGDEVEVIEILVSKGDSLEAEDSLITVESDGHPSTVCRCCG